MNSPKNGIEADLDQSMEDLSCLDSNTEDSIDIDESVANNLFYFDEKNQATQRIQHLVQRVNFDEEQFLYQAVQLPSLNHQLKVITNQVGNDQPQPIQDAKIKSQSKIIDQENVENKSWAKLFSISNQVNQDDIEKRRDEMNKGCWKKLSQESCLGQAIATYPFSMSSSLSSFSQPSLDSDYSITDSKDSNPSGLKSQKGILDPILLSSIESSESSSSYPIANKGDHHLMPLNHDEIESSQDEWHFAQNLPSTLPPLSLGQLREPRTGSRKSLNHIMNRPILSIQNASYTRTKLHQLPTWTRVNPVTPRQPNSPNWNKYDSKSQPSYCNIESIETLSQDDASETSNKKQKYSQDQKLSISSGDDDDIDAGNMIEMGSYHEEPVDNSDEEKIVDHAIAINPVGLCPVVQDENRIRFRLSPSLGRKSSSNTTTKPLHLDRYSRILSPNNPKAITSRSSWIWNMLWKACPEQSNIKVEPCVQQLDDQRLFLILLGHEIDTNYMLFMVKMITVSLIDEEPGRTDCQTKPDIRQLETEISLLILNFPRVNGSISPGDLIAVYPPSESYAIKNFSWIMHVLPELKLMPEVFRITWTTSWELIDADLLLQHHPTINTKLPFPFLHATCVNIKFMPSLFREMSTMQGSKEIGQQDKYRELERLPLSRIMQKTITNFPIEDVKTVDHVDLNNPRLPHCHQLSSSTINPFGFCGFVKVNFQAKIVLVSNGQNHIMQDLSVQPSLPIGINSLAVESRIRSTSLKSALAQLDVNYHRKINDLYYGKEDGTYSLNVLRENAYRDPSRSVSCPRRILVNLYNPPVNSLNPSNIWITIPEGFNVGNLEPGMICEFLRFYYASHSSISCDLSATLSPIFAKGHITPNRALIQKYLIQSRKKTQMQSPGRLEKETMKIDFSREKLPNIANACLQVNEQDTKRTVTNVEFLATPSSAIKCIESCPMDQSMTPCFEAWQDLDRMQGKRICIHGKLIATIKVPFKLGKKNHYQLGLEPCEIFVVVALPKPQSRELIMLRYQGSACSKIPTTIGQFLQMDNVLCLLAEHVMEIDEWTQFHPDPTVQTPCYVLDAQDLDSARLYPISEGIKTLYRSTSSKASTNKDSSPTFIQSQLDSSKNFWQYLEKIHLAIEQDVTPCCIQCHHILVSIQSQLIEWLADRESDEIQIEEHTGGSTQSEKSFTNQYYYCRTCRVASQSANRPMIQIEALVTYHNREYLIIEKSLEDAFKQIMKIKMPGLEENSSKTGTSHR